MAPFIPSLSTLAVSAIFCLWQVYRRQVRLDRERIVRQRVAYMLWEAANRS